MGIFDDVIDGVGELSSDIFRTTREITKDITFTLATPVVAVSVPVIAATLGVTIGMVEAAIAAGNMTVGEVRDWIRDNDLT